MSDNQTLPAGQDEAAVVKFEGPKRSDSRLPHLERQFDLMTKGARSLGIGFWEDRFDEMRVEARDGTVTAEQIAELIDYDYENGQDPKAGATTLIAALLADAMSAGRHAVSFDEEHDVLTFDGFKFSGALMRGFTATPCGQTFRIVARKDGAIHISLEQSPLAAAAPDMLAALKLALPAIKDEPDKTGAADGIRAAIIEAIAKAEPQS